MASAFFPQGMPLPSMEEPTVRTALTVATRSRQPSQRSKIWPSFLQLSPNKYYSPDTAVMVVVIVVVMMVVMMIVLAILLIVIRACSDVRIAFIRRRPMPYPDTVGG
jgi:hypothetical protein